MGVMAITGQRPQDARRLDYDAAQSRHVTNQVRSVAGVVTAIVYGAIRRLARIVLVHHHIGHCS
jgi:hypothetical protein